MSAHTPSYWALMLRCAAQSSMKPATSMLVHFVLLHLQVWLNQPSFKDTWWSCRHPCTGTHKQCWYLQRDPIHRQSASGTWRTLWSLFFKSLVLCNIVFKAMLRNITQHILELNKFLLKCHTMHHLVWTWTVLNWIMLMSHHNCEPALSFMKVCEI